MNKEILRQTFLEKRKFLTKEEYKRRNEEIFTNFFDLVSLDKIKVIHTFLPITAQQEVDTWPIVHELNEEWKFIRLCVSKTITTENRLEHYYFHEKDPLKNNGWGIPEPIWGEKVEVKDIDMVLVPLIVFDKKGNRIGYGKGYYDKFLSECREDVIKVGLSLSPPLDEILYCDALDVPLDFFITPFGRDDVL